MPKKVIAAKKLPAKIKKESAKIKSKRKEVTKKWKEIMERKIKYATQRWFFSLDEKEQAFLETTYMIVVQICPELTWEDFLDRLRKADKINTWAKSVVKTVVWKF